MAEKEKADLIKYHYDLVRDDEKKILKKLELALPFHRFYFLEKIKGWEIIYDTQSHLLSSAGVVLSKQMGKDGTFFKVRKISTIPGLNPPSKKFYLTECNANGTPKDFALQMATAINNVFSNIFTIDLAEVVKQTSPIIEIIVKARVYEINGGTGYRGRLMFEDVCYFDLVSRKKVKRQGVTFSLPSDEIYKEETNEILEGIERHCKSLLPYKKSRFEIAQRLLGAANRAPERARKTKETK